jgi:hypothetical protein
MLRTLLDLVVLAARRAAKSWLAALSIPIYTLIFFLAAGVLTKISTIGTLLLGFVEAALCAGYLSLLASSVQGEKIRWVDLRNGMRAIWDVMSVFFVLWIVNLVLTPVLRNSPNATAIAGLVQLAIAIFLNAVPEVLYLRGARSVQAISESASFVMENPVMWFGPNLVLAVVFLAATIGLSFTSAGEAITTLSGLASADGVVALIASTARQPWKIPLLIFFVHFAMVFRGLLFQELGTGNARMRAFRRRMS